MIDDQLILRSFLATDGPIAGLVAGRVFAARNTPPEGWNPASGACICFKRRGDGPLDESGKVIGGSYQVKCYGGGGNTNQQILSAEAVYRAVYDRLNYGTSYAVLGCQKEGGTETLLEQGTEWPFTLSFWRAQLRKTG
jgi:hypothetical protein